MVSTLFHFSAHLWNVCLAIISQQIDAAVFTVSVSFYCWNIASVLVASRPSGNSVDGSKNGKQRAPLAHNCKTCQLCDFPPVLPNLGQGQYYF